MGMNNDEASICAVEQKEACELRPEQQERSSGAIMFFFS